MNSGVQELYTETVRQWPISERLRLAVLILDDLANPILLRYLPRARRSAKAKGKPRLMSYCVTPERSAVGIRARLTTNR